MGIFVGDCFVFMKIEKRYLSAPLMAQFEVTNLCNHRCIHCYNLDSKIENRPIQKVSDKIVLGVAQRLIDSGIFSIVVTGGEPLIKKELTKKVIQLFVDNNIKVGFNSNLTLFDDDFIEFLKDKNIRVLTSCPSAIPTSFEKLVSVDNYFLFEKNIQKMFAEGLKFTVNMVITKNNLTEVRTTAEKMKNLGCRCFSATPMFLNMDYPRFDLLLSKEDVLNVITDLLWIEKTLEMEVDILESLPKCIFPEKILFEEHIFLNRKCQAGRTVIGVSCNGDITPCSTNSISYGNILNEDIKVIWAKMSDWRSMQYIPQECQDCSWLNRCNAGCRINSKTIYGKWNSKEVWSTNPIINQPPQEYTTIVLKPETLLQVNPNYKCRKEDENIYVFYNESDETFFMVNKTYRDFIQTFNDNEKFTFGDLRQRYNITDIKVFHNVILFLIQKGILNLLFN
jgi:radical SAM protein with 4Fe4S-binding SPASM domain